MNSEIKNCQNCHRDFTIAPEDFGFYEKMRVPAPTFCPDCRFMRRYAWRNERALYKAKCGKCGKDIFSAYAPEKQLPVFCHDCWFSDSWDPIYFGQEYDFSKPFFEQFQALSQRVPRLNLFQVNVVNSPYSNIIRDVKNVYLTYSCVSSEEIYYSKNIDRCKQIFDSLNTTDSEQGYGSHSCTRNYDVHASYLTHSSLNSALLFDCVNVNHCFLSASLRNKQYYIRNKKYATKEEYEVELKKLNTGSYAAMQKLLAECEQLRLNAIHRYAHFTLAVNSTGDFAFRLKNAKNVFETYDAEDVRYLGRCFEIKDSMDVNNTGLSSELVYEYTSGGKNNRLTRMSLEALDGLSDVHYTISCGQGTKLFGCFGLRNKQYCILNKQYTKEEYEAMLPKIIQHMNELPYVDKKGRVYAYGEFFPIKLSPFAFNNSVAHEHFKFSKAEVLAQGYNWRDSDLKNPKIDISAKDLPDHINDAGDEILAKTIGCGHAGQCLDQCTFAFRIIKPELDLYRRIQFPLPRLCPNCRHYERLKLRHPWRLWRRNCKCLGNKSERGYRNTVEHFHGDKPCTNEFDTSYAPERPEVLYCEQCYQQEVV